jgi:aquaporin related protein
MVAGNWQNHWVYWFGDFLGAAAAGFTQSFFSHRPVQNSGGP